MASIMLDTERGGAGPLPSDRPDERGNVEDRVVDVASPPRPPIFPGDVLSSELVRSAFAPPDSPLRRCSGASNMMIKGELKAALPVIQQKTLQTISLARKVQMEDLKQLLIQGEDYPTDRGLGGGDRNNRLADLERRRTRIEEVLQDRIKALEKVAADEGFWGRGGVVDERSVMEPGTFASVQDKFENTAKAGGRAATSNRGWSPHPRGSSSSSTIQHDGGMPPRPTEEHSSRKILRPREERNEVSSFPVSPLLHDPQPERSFLPPHSQQSSSSMRTSPPHEQSTERTASISNAKPFGFMMAQFRHADDRLVPTFSQAAGTVDQHVDSTQHQLHFSTTADRDVRDSYSVLKSQDRAILEEQLLEEQALHAVKTELTGQIQQLQDELRRLRAPVFEEIPKAFQMALVLVNQHGCRELAWADGFSPVHWGAQAGRQDVIEYLLTVDGGPELLRARDKKGRIPYDYAKAQGHEEICRWFEEMGAQEPEVGSRGHRKGRSVGGSGADSRNEGASKLWPTKPKGRTMIVDFRQIRQRNQKTGFLQISRPSESTHNLTNSFFLSDVVLSSRSPIPVLLPRLTLTTQTHDCPRDFSSPIAHLLRKLIRSHTLDS